MQRRILSSSFFLHRPHQPHSSPVIKDLTTTSRFLPSSSSTTTNVRSFHFNRNGSRSCRGFASKAEESKEDCCEKVGSEFEEEGIPQDITPCFARAFDKEFLEQNGIEAQLSANPFLDFQPRFWGRFSNERDLSVKFTHKDCGMKSEIMVCKKSFQGGVVIALCSGCYNLVAIADPHGWFRVHGHLEGFASNFGIWEQILDGSFDSMNIIFEDLDWAGGNDKVICGPSKPLW